MSLKRWVLVLAMAAAPSLALAEDSHGANTAPPCGWRGGAMSDPAATQRCLASRFKPPKPKVAEEARPSPPKTDSGSPPASPSAAQTNLRPSS